MTTVLSNQHPHLFTQTEYQIKRLTADCIRDRVLDWDLGTLDWLMILFFCKLGFAGEARSSAEMTYFKQSSVHSISVHHKLQMWSRPLSVCVCGYEVVYWRPVCLIAFLSLSSCFPWLWWSVRSSTNDLGFGLVSDSIVTDCSGLVLTGRLARTGHGLDHMIQFSPVFLHAIDNYLYFIRMTLSTLLALSLEDGERAQA